MTALHRGSLMLLALAACATPREPRATNTTTTTSTSSAGAVRVDSVRPAPVDLIGPGVAELRIYGAGFTPDSNDVRFDDISVAMVKSETGASLYVRLIKALPSTGGAPMAVMAGDHSLQVKNARGSSNTVQLKVQSP